ncbi:MAG: SpoIIE family protein phosphatase [Deltaproteobacteria bacterium]|nr:SpoIIE family protein phosphatase [Deltaproteobacteria bacterium]
MAAETDGAGLGKWRAATALALVPAAATAAWGAALLAREPTVLGAAVLGGGLLLAVFHHLVVQRAIDRALSPQSRDLTTAALAFARRALRLRRIEEVGALLSTTVNQALGMLRTLVVVPEPGTDAARVLGDPQATAAAADDAYVYLAGHPYPVPRGLADPEAEPVRQLCQRLDAEVAFGLRHRGELLGVLLVGQGAGPLGDRELGFLHRLGLQATVAIANTHLFDEARGRARLSREVDLATAVVEDLLPAEALQRSGSVSVRGLCRPAAECGGDFWFWRPLGDGRGLLAIGDVTGHGLPAAIVAATAKGCCEACIADQGGREPPGPADILAALNRAVFHSGQGRYHMSCFVALLDGSRHEIRFANAGHNFPYVLTPRAGEPPHLAPLIARGNTLGQVERAEYTEATRPLAPGERLVLYTDGVVEALSETGEPFGDKRFRRALVERGAETVEALATGLYRTVSDHMGARPPADDITLVVAAFEATGGGAA